MKEITVENHVVPASGRSVIVGIFLGRIFFDIVSIIGVKVRIILGLKVIFIILCQGVGSIVGAFPIAVVIRCIPGAGRIVVRCTLVIVVASVGSLGILYGRNDEGEYPYR